MRVACIQLSSGENYKLNFSKLIKHVKVAVKARADIIITPEASSILSVSKKKILNNSYKMEKDPVVKMIKKISKKNKKWILIGSLFIKDGKKLRNRSIMINPSGQIEEYYDKISMFNANLSNKEIHNESKYFVPGRKLKVVNLPWGKLGLTICFDLRFPEIFRKLSKKNINFIAVPSAFTKITGQKHWMTLLKARAIENFCYIFAPAQTGKNTIKRETFGHTTIISPDGKVLKLKKKHQGVVYADINPKLSMELRNKISSLKSSIKF